ncbi:MAG: hypothetical protein Kow0029_10410 [Candidatus Rifleibacteriota bacterium]
MFSGNLKIRLIFLFFTLILLTNGIFALVAVSREKIQLSESLFEDAKSLGLTLLSPSAKFFRNGNLEDFNNILDNRAALSAELKVTLYDLNWWRKAGDEPRIPLEGFPIIENLNKMAVKTGSGNTTRELFFPVILDGVKVGALGIGIPRVETIGAGASSSDFIIILAFNLLFGVIAAIIFAKSILKPLEGLMAGIDAFADGNYALRVETCGEGELRQLCETFNRMAATVQENVKENLLRNRMLDEKLQELWEIYEITKNLSIKLDLNLILEKFLEKAQTLSFSSNSQIIMKNRVSNRLEPVLDNHPLPAVKLEDYENALNACFLEGKLYEKVSNAYSMIFVPLLSGGNVQGVLFLAKRDSSEYSEGIKRFLQTIAPVAASMIVNARLYEELSSWNANMKNILCSVNAGLGAIDRKGKIITANESFFNIFPELYAIDPIETIQEFCRSLADKEFANSVIEAVKPFMAPFSEEVCRSMRIRHKLSYKSGDRLLNFEVRIMPLLDGESVNGSVIVFDDITEQQKIEQQMIETEKWAVLGKLAASVAHEIRNPLVAIRSLVEIIGEEVQGNLKEHVTVILGEVQRLNRVVAELLSLVKPVSAQMRIADMKEVLNELVLLIRHEASKNGIVIKTEITNEDCKILIDTEKIKQAFLNVILNGIQAVGKNGEILVRLYRVGKFLHVSFGNNGPEIPKENIDKVFDAFFTTKSNGTGLGLAITKKIAELHNGRIEIKSSPEFTEFIFVLPLEA